MDMHCRIADLRCKEVINIKDGLRLGFVCDVILNTATGCILAIVVPGMCRFFGLLGRKESAFFRWESVKRFGAQTVLVEGKPELRRVNPLKRRW